MSAASTGKRNSILQAVFDLCPSDFFDARIAGRRPNRRIRSPICHLHEALKSLRQRFADQELIAAGVAKRNNYGELQLAPELCHPDGVIMALRTTPGEPPFDLLTARGSLAGGRHPVLSVFDNHRRKTLADETGIILAVRRICDAAGLDLCDLPATCGLGLSRLGMSALHEIDARYGEGLPRFSVPYPEEDEEPADPPDERYELYWNSPGPDESPAFRPMLVLVDRLKQRPGQEPSRWLRRTAERLASVRRNTGLSFSGVWVWAPDESWRAVTICLRRTGPATNP